jgi:hypothetical protein
VFAIVVGAGLIIRAFELKPTSSAGVDTLTDASVAIFLFLPLYWVQNRSYRAVRQVQSQQVVAKAEIKELSETVAEIQEGVRQANLRIDEIGSATLGLIDEQKDSDSLLLDEFEKSPNWKTTRAILERGKYVGAVDARVGARLGASPTWLWFGTSTRPARSAGYFPAIEVMIDAPSLNSNDHHSVLWGPPEEPHELMLKVANQLKYLGSYPGDENFDAGAVFGTVGNTIRRGIEFRHEGREIGKLFAIVNDDWAITSFGLESLGEAYRVPRDAILNVPYGEIPPPLRKSATRGTQERFNVALESALHFFDS